MKRQTFSQHQHDKQNGDPEGQGGEILDTDLEGRRRRLVDQGFGDAAQRVACPVWQTSIWPTPLTIEVPANAALTAS